MKNQAVIDEIEKAARAFKPVTYDVTTILKGIEGFEQEAVKSARETEKKIQEQLKDLETTIKNIEEARAPDELSVCPPSQYFDGWVAHCRSMIYIKPFPICIRELSEWFRRVFGW